MNTEQHEGQALDPIELGPYISVLALGLLPGGTKIWDDVKSREVVILNTRFAEAVNSRGLKFCQPLNDGRRFRAIRPTSEGVRTVIDALREEAPEAKPDPAPTVFHPSEFTAVGMYAVLWAIWLAISTWLFGLASTPGRFGMLPLAVVAAIVSSVFGVAGYNGLSDLRAKALGGEA